MGALQITLLLIIVLLRPLSAADRTAKDFNLKTEELGPALKGKWDEARIACAIQGREPIGIALTRSGNQARIKAFYGDEVAEETPISSETLGDIISAAIRFHELASAPARERVPTEEKNFHQESSPGILFEFKRGLSSRSCHVAFKQDTDLFAQWLLRKIEVCKDRPNLGTPPNEVGKLLNGPWQGLEVELAFQKSGSKPQGIRLARQGDRVTVTPYARAGSNYAEGKTRELDAANLPETLAEFLNHYTVAFNGRDETEASLKEKLAERLRLYSANMGSPFEEWCGTRSPGEIEHPHAKLVINLTNSGKRTVITNGLDVAGYFKLAPHFAKDVPDVFD